MKDLKDPEPPPATSSCKKAAEHMIDLVVASLEKRPPDDAVNDLVELIRNRCEKDAWTADAQQCFSQIKTANDADACGTKLTEAQTKALIDEQAAKAQSMPNNASTEVEPTAQPQEGTPGPRTRGAMPPPPPAKEKAPGTQADPCDGGE